MKKFSELSTRLKIAKKKANKNSFTNNKKNSSALGTALKLSTEMVAAVFVGSIIGFILDNWFDSKPWLTVIFFFVGAVAGISNVIRSAKLMQENNDEEKLRK
jgi:ATP synthase protein I